MACSCASTTSKKTTGPLLCPRYPVKRIHKEKPQQVCACALGKTHHLSPPFVTRKYILLLFWPGCAGVIHLNMIGGNKQEQECNDTTY